MNILACIWTSPLATVVLWATIVPAAAADPRGPAPAVSLAQQRETVNQLWLSNDPALKRRSCLLQSTIAKDSGDYRDLCKSGGCYWKLEAYPDAAKAFQGCADLAHSGAEAAAPDMQANLLATEALARVYAQACDRLLASHDVVQAASADLAAAASATSALQAEAKQANAQLRAATQKNAETQAAQAAQLAKLRLKLKGQQVAMAKLAARVQALHARNLQFRQQVAALLQRIAELERDKLGLIDQTRRLAEENRNMRALLAAHEQATGLPPRQ